MGRRESDGPAGKAVRAAPNARFPGCQDTGDFSRLAHDGGRSILSLTCTMRTAARIAVSAPPTAARARVTRAGRRRAPAGAHARERARGLASALLGALAGLAVGAAFVASAPAVGRAASADAAPARVPRGVAGQASGVGASSVSAVLAPAIEAGVVPAPDPEASGP